MEIREAELDTLITEIAHPLFLKKELSFTAVRGVCLDMSKLVIMGH